jgi:hypothetical protein
MGQIMESNTSPLGPFFSGSEISAKGKSGIAIWNTWDLLRRN